MDNLQSHYAKEFARFYVNSFPNMPCKPVPSKLEDLNFTEKTALQQWEGGVLYQNMFRDAKSLPADVLGRYLKGGRYHVGDQEALRNSGFIADANRVEAQIEEGRQQLREKELAAITARNQARDKELQRQMQMSGAEKMAQKPIGFWDPSAVAFRRQYGISDEIGAGL